jgi:hypothetical protein
MNDVVEHPQGGFGVVGEHDNQGTSNSTSE